MRKYLETTKLLFKAQIIYRFDTIISMLFTISKIILAYVLWGAIFKDKDLVAGFTFNTMITYYILSSFIAQLDQSSGTGGQISRDIRGGGFSKYMVRPMSIFGYFTSQTLGVSLFLLTFNFIAAILWVFVFKVDFSLSKDPVMLISATTITLLGLFLMMQLNFYIGILAFKFLDTGIFMMIKDNIMQFATGALIPLAILPEKILEVMSYLPFYYVVYLPSMLFLGQRKEEIFFGISVLIVWNIFFLVLNKLTFKWLRTKYDGVGI